MRVLAWVVAVAKRLETAKEEMEGQGVAARIPRVEVVRRSLSGRG